MINLLSQLPVESAVRFPDNTAVICGNDRLSYKELDLLSGRLAASLRKNGVENGDRIGIYMRKSPDSIVALFGILKAGAVYVPLDWFSPFDRLSLIVTDCRMKALVVSAEGYEKIRRDAAGAPLPGRLFFMLTPSAAGVVPSQDTTVIKIDEIRTTDPIDPVTDGIISGDPAYILYTSGSTGKPKGVVLSHLNALTFVRMATVFFNITSTDRIANLAPLHFDLSVFDLFCGFLAGGSVVLITEKEASFPVAVLKSVEKYGVTIWNSVPSALIQLITRTPFEKGMAASLRLVLFAGELFPPKYLRKLMEGIPHAGFYNLYGQTEANSSTWYRVVTPPADDTERLPIGKPFPDYDVFALDENNNRLTMPGCEGELYVRGAAVACGYWNDPERTDLQFVKNPLERTRNEIVFKTGDVVTVDSDGNYIFIGRKDAMIKSRGYRIDIGDIESALYSLPEVAEAALVTVPDEEIGNRLVAFVVPKQGCAVLPDTCLAHCARKVPKYMVPEQVIIRNSFPVTATGKVDRKILAATIST